MGLLAVDLGLNLVGLIADGADELVAVGLGEGQGTRGNNVELATSGQVVNLSNVKGNLDSLARGDDLEGLLAQVFSRKAKA